MRIGFFGAAREVPGSCFLVETSAGNLLVDCGYFHGRETCSERNYAAFGFDTTSIQVVLVTHAHIDHTGRLPRLFQQGGRPRIFSTEPTKELAELTLEDVLTIQTEEAERCGLDPLYEEEDLDRCMKAWDTVAYRRMFEVLPGVLVTFHDTGHILGSSFVVVEADGKRVAFSGDVGGDQTLLLHDTEALPSDVDLLVCESTYGDRLHPKVLERKQQLRAHLERNFAQSGVLMVPAFSIERTQEILFEINELVEQEGVHCGPVFLDSPLSVAAIGVFRRHSNDAEVMDLAFAKKWGDDNLFSFKGLQVALGVDDSKKINDVPVPKVIIAGSGMMDSGRIQHHLIRYLDSPNNTLLITGYQADGTTGRRIQDGAMSIELLGYSVPVRAHVEKIESYSGHADYNKLGNWIRHALPKKVALVHGSAEAQDAFAKYLEHLMSVEVSAPEFGGWVEV